MFVRRRPLLRGAMIGGAGFLAGRSAARAAERKSEQETRLAELEAQPQAAPGVPAPAPAGGGDLVSKLQELKSLQQEGVLTPDEFVAREEAALQ
jgi:hypothetical protein